MIYAMCIARDNIEFLVFLERRRGIGIKKSGDEPRRGTRASQSAVTSFGSMETP